MYPKWIERSKDLGPVLATDEGEEKAIIAHWQKQEKALKKQAETDADQTAETAQ